MKAPPQPPPGQQELQWGCASTQSTETRAVLRCPGSASGIPLLSTLLSLLLLLLISLLLSLLLYSCSFPSPPTSRMLSPSLGAHQHRTPTVPLCRAPLPCRNQIAPGVPKYSQKMKKKKKKFDNTLFNPLALSTDTHKPIPTAQSPIIQLTNHELRYRDVWMRGCGSEHQSLRLSPGAPLPPSPRHKPRRHTRGSARSPRFARRVGKTWVGAAMLRCCAAPGRAALRDTRRSLRAR